jgi:hypothetical protein
MPQMFHPNMLNQVKTGEDTRQTRMFITTTITTAALWTRALGPEGMGCGTCHNGYITLPSATLLPSDAPPPQIPCRPHFIRQELFGWTNLMVQPRLPRTCPHCDSTEYVTFTHAILTCPAKSSERDALIPRLCQRSRSTSISSKTLTRSSLTDT